MMTPPPSARATPLAIVIPAFKIKYLRETLASIAAQTDKNFQLYVFDDCSPDPVESIVREFAESVPVCFHRFEENLGGISLARHWDRCLGLTSEPWIWIFADDDVMEAGCVADFYAELSRTQPVGDLYRFGTFWIDGTGRQVSESPLHPSRENGTDFLLARLGGKRNVTMQEAIFSRQGWEFAGGLPDFPLGWHSDAAFTARAGVRHPLYAIPGSRVGWRYSDVNISSVTARTVADQKLAASLLFFHWVVKFFQEHATAQVAAVRRLSEAWLMKYLGTRSWTFISLRSCFALDQLAREAWRRPPGWGFMRGMWINLKLFIFKIGQRMGWKKPA